MSEYHQIQTYIKYDKVNIHEKIEKFKVALYEMGFNSKFIEEGLSDFKWKVEDNGFVYSLSNFESKVLKYNGVELQCRPLLLGWTPSIDENLKDSWLEVSILFETNEITDELRNGRLKIGVRDLILGQMKILSKYFSETGTYFTNETTDGNPWEALIGIGKLVWAFDIAIIPYHLDV